MISQGTVPIPLVFIVYKCLRYVFSNYWLDILIFMFIYNIRIVKKYLEVFGPNRMSTAQLLIQYFFDSRYYDCKAYQ